jgi:hypothetical protein
MSKLIGDAILILSACAIARLSCESDSEIVQGLAWAYCIIVAVLVPMEIAAGRTLSRRE